jgi:hypothetical protein
MTDQELTDAIRRLREFAIAQGMQWVINEVDEAIAVGVPETRTLRQTNRAGRTTYEDVTEPTLRELTADPERRRRNRRSEEARRGHQDFVRSRPMTSREQAQLLIHALRRVLTDLDAIADGTFNSLDPGSLSGYLDVAINPALDDYPAPHIETIRFAPEEGSTAPAVDMDVMRGAHRRTRVADLLGRIETEIQS